MRSFSNKTFYELTHLVQTNLRTVRHMIQERTFIIESNFSIMK